MAQKTKLEILSDIRARVEADIAGFNAALRKGDNFGMTKADSSMRTDLKDYADNKMIEVFDRIAKMHNPVCAALKERTYDVLWFKEVREKGVLMRIDLKEDREVQIDILKFCEYIKASTDWQYAAEKLNFLLAVRAAKALDISVDELKELNDSYMMNEVSRKIDLGCDPTSNNQLCKALQDVVDKMLPEAERKEVPLKLYNKDVEYILLCYTKRGRGGLSVAMSKHSFLRTLVYDACNRSLCEKFYSIVYKKAPVIAPADSSAKAEPVAVEPVAVEKPVEKKSAKKVVSKTIPARV